MTIIEAIHERHSVRTYTDRKIEEDKAELIREKIAELNNAGRLNLQFLEDAGDTYNKLISRASGLRTAPSVIACVGEDAVDLDERIGYYGEQLVLFLQQLGLNTCWTGIFNKKKTKAQIGPSERLAITIAVGYGKTQGKPRKSKTADQVTGGKNEKPEWFDNGVRLALLAPTAINQQKFLIQLNDDDTVTFVDKGGPFSQVDLGIVKCHFEIGAKEKT